MKKLLALAITIGIVNYSFSQIEKFDIASFNPPQGWQRLDSNGVLVFHDYRTKDNLTSFAQIILFQSRPTNSNATKNFNDEWSTRVSQPTGLKTKPTTQSEKTPDGWTAVTGYANITQSGLSYMRMLVTATGFGRTMSIMVNTAGTEHASAIDKFFKELNLDSKTALAFNDKKSNSMTGTNSYADYEFVAPQGWFLKNNNDHLVISQTQVQGQGCVILMIPSVASSGNLETDVQNVFNQMYPGWSYRNNGEKKYNLTKGYTAQGLEYYMLEAGMSKPSADGSRYDGFEDGAALVIKNGNKIGIISVRHNTSLLAHNDCLNKYETWLRFFNSIQIKNATAAKANEEAPNKRILGIWKLQTNGVASGEYVFAANGNYQLGGAIGSSTTTSDFRYEYLYLKSYNFQGDGSYAINGNQLKFMKRGTTNADVARIRFSKVNHGGFGWNDRIHLLKTGPDQKEYEVTYEKAPPTPPAH